MIILVLKSAFFKSLTLSGVLVTIPMAITISYPTSAIEILLFH